MKTEEDDWKIYSTILVNFVIFHTTYSLKSGGLFDAFFVKRGRRQRKMVSGTFMTAF